jgi:hypothetical protein
VSKLIDLSNQRFGFWVVSKRAINSKNGQVQWLCRCECGREKIVTANSLRSGNSTSCGCNHNPDLSNLTFGNLTVLKIKPSVHSRRHWECQCACGNFITTTTYKLRGNIITSCGCDTLVENIQNTVDAGRKFNGFLETIISNFTVAEKLILDSRTLSNMTGPIVMGRGLRLIQEQIEILSLLNVELQGSITSLSDLNVDSRQNSILERAIEKSCTLLQAV